MLQIACTIADFRSEMLQIACKIADLRSEMLQIACKIADLSSNMQQVANSKENCLKLKHKKKLKKIITFE